MKNSSRCEGDKKKRDKEELRKRTKGYREEMRRGRGG